MEHHPDRNGGCEDATARFKEINEAYSVLSDPQKRAAYDRFGHAGVNGMNGGGRGGFNDVHDIFNEVFGDVFGDMFGRRRQRPNGPARGQDLRYDLEITLEQAYAGAEVEIKVPAAAAPAKPASGSGAKPGTSPTTCATCGGAGRVRRSQGFFPVETHLPALRRRRPAGARSLPDLPRPRPGAPRADAGGAHSRRRRRRLAHPPGRRGRRRRQRAARAATSTSSSRCEPHELFERDGLDLLCSVPVPMATAALGGEIEAPCLLGGENCDGECKIRVKVPEGAQTGRTVRLSGRGMPSLRSRERGDLVVELFIETPTKLTAQQKELLREFAGLCGEQQHPQSASFFEKARGSGTTSPGSKAAPEGPFQRPVNAPISRQ